METKLKKIKAFVFDVDGVLTDGGLFADLNGEFYRTFDSKDGFALRMAIMHGYHLGIITGGRSESIRMRFQACGVNPQDVYLGSRNKIIRFEAPFSKAILPIILPIPDAPPVMSTFAFLNFITTYINFRSAKLSQ